MAVLNRLINVAKSILGTSNESLLKTYDPLVAEVARREAEMAGADDEALRGIADRLRARVRDEDASLAEVRAETFALVREVADRRLGMWKAILDPSLGFDDWGEHADAVAEARARLEEGANHWNIDLPAGVYARIRDAHPDSVPPFRMRAFDVQIVGAGALHDGRIAEMKTGEGKTLVAIFACFLNSLGGKGVHVVTVNDYLAHRDATDNRPVFGFLGATVSAIQSEMKPEQRRETYACDVVYGTNNEFGFDYLRDNLKQQREDQVQTRHDYAIVDEVDSVLIDEARTPLIISGPAESHTEWFKRADEVARQLEPERDFEIDLKDRSVSLTEEGIQRATELFEVESLYEGEFMHLPHFLDNALKAHHLYLRDRQYLIQGRQIRIVDEFTGRAMPGRRWSDGLHQAIEAKEGVPIQEESQTYATITLQNFFRLYGKLAGMTGTAMTEADEFHAIYKLQVVAIPTDKPVIRRDMPDLIYGSEPEKFDAIVDEVAELYAAGQPILVGTISVDVSERLSKELKRKGVRHNVLNARQHQREADVVANAGKLAAVTIATNMAGRGTDIKLGTASYKELIKHWKANDLVPRRLDHKGDPALLDEACTDLWAKRWLGDEEAEKLRGQEPRRILEEVNRKRHAVGWAQLDLPSSFVDGCDVRRLGGLRIIGTERHEARRIDNQLRGRSGRQGDPGSSRFYLSLDDDLMKRFAGPRMAGLMRSLGLKDGVPIESKMVSNAVEKAQKRVEEYHFGIRKNLLEYDQVMNTQRAEIYRQRQRILEGDDPEGLLIEQFDPVLDDLVQESASDGTRGPELAARIAERFREAVNLEISPDAIPVRDGGDACHTMLMEKVKEGIAKRREEWHDGFEFLLRMVLLETIDRCWKDHLYAMDHLRAGIGLEGYGQKDPKLRYREEGFRFFRAMQDRIRQGVSNTFFRLQVQITRPGEGGGPAGGSRAPRAQRDGGDRSSAEMAMRAGGFRPAPAPELGPPESPSAPPQPTGTSTLREPGTDAGEPGPEDPCPCGSGRLYKNCHGVF